MFTWEIARAVSSAMAKLGDKGAAMADLSTLELDKLPAAQQQVVRDAYAGALGDIFVPLLLLSLIGLVCVSLMKGSELISEYAENPQSHQASEKERELVRRALEKDKVSHELSRWVRNKVRKAAKNASPDSDSAARKTQGEGEADFQA